MKQNTLIIISVPFKRNSRYLLSSLLYSKLKENYNILIVSSFKISSTFKAEFSENNVNFYECNLFNKSRILNFLYNLSELIRTNGYYFRHRNKGLEYEWFQTTNISFDNDKGPFKKKIKSSFISYITGFIGYYRKSWNFFDFLFGRFFYNTDSLINIAKPYKKTVIVQTANFHYQERFLSYTSSLLESKLIMAPYTTDQLSINGYLIGDYDIVCTQGTVEENYLLKFHDINAGRIFKMGSIWFRNIENIFKENNYDVTHEGLNNEKTIMYAGISSTYFNPKIELKAIDRILKEINNGHLKNCKLIYRPVLSDFEMDKLIKKYEEIKYLEIQRPQASMIGMTEFSEEIIGDEIKKYVKDIASIDVLVVSQLTTILFDALFLDKPAICYNVNETDFDKKRNDLYVSEDSFEVHLSGVPAIFNSLDKLISQIKKYINEPESIINIKEKFLSRWDTTNDDYINEFISLIENNKKQ